MQAYLLLNAGANSGARFELTESEQNLMGRDWECRIVLNDPQCSRVHAEIFHEDDGWWIRDNKSSNGTYVNGQSVEQARLVEGTQVKVGASSFTFNLLNPDEALSDSADNSDSEGLTIVLDQSMNPKETGQYTLDFLKGQNWGQDFFFLFQLSVKLLSVDEPDQVISICMKRLFDRTSASAAGFLWLSEEGILTPRVFFPEDQADILELNPALTSRVVTERRALRVEKGTGETKKPKHCLLYTSPSPRDRG